ncbi:UNVERIFIED_CONTAM: putative membrane protein YfcA [Brevibacillus sp. OAP136]
MAKIRMTNKNSATATSTLVSCNNIVTEISNNVEIGVDELEFEYLLRVLIAAVCGAIIGYERKNRMKEAGIRTHFVVAVGASLMMVLSKYGFQDQLGWHNLSLARLGFLLKW